MSTYRLLLCVFVVALIASQRTACYAWPATPGPSLVGDIQITIPGPDGNPVLATEGCAGQTQFTFTVINMTEDYAQAQPGRDYDIFDGQTVQDTRTGHDDPCTYTWRVGTSSACQSDPVIGTTGLPPNNQLTYTFAAAGTYHVCLTIDDPGVIFDDPPRTVTATVYIR